MNDYWTAIKTAFDAHTDAGDPYTLVGGRIYRSGAPERATMPYIVISLIGGPILWLFDSQRIEQARIQIDIFDELANGAPTRAMTIWHGLVEILEFAELTPADGSTHIIMRREGLPREIIEDGIVHVSGDWLCERESVRSFS